MKLPGHGWLEFEVTPRPDGASTVRQTASFDARGLGGRCYWHLLYPVHVLLFAGLLRAIARRAGAEVEREPAQAAGKALPSSVAADEWNRSERP